MQKITPFLWFNNNAEEAINFYISNFKNSKIGNITRYGEAGPGPKGIVMSATFQLGGQEFMALNGGPYYTFTPAISLFVNCETQEEIDGLWKKFSNNGTVLMELNTYPFSEKFGWCNDKFGLSWQFNLANKKKIKQKISPFLMFVGEQSGKAEEAINVYTSLLKNSKILTLELYGEGEHGQKGTVKHGKFSLNGQEFMAMDSDVEPAFTFTPAISFFVSCETQEEIDQLWEKFSEGGEKSSCGWLKDKYGVSWQIIPPILGKLLSDKDPEKSKRVMQAMLKMKKIDIRGLEQAYEENL